MAKKIFLATITILIVLALTIPNVVQAVSISNIFNGADTFVNNGKAEANNAINIQALNDASGLLYNTLLIIGVCAAVIVGAVLGVKFITGSVEQKVKVKESLIPFIIGCVVIFSAFGIWRLVIIVLR